MAKNTLFLILALLATASSNDHGRLERTFSLSHSVLLFGTFDGRLALIDPQQSRVLAAPSKASFNRPLAVASLQQSGENVSWGFPVEDDPQKRWKVRCSVGVYSLASASWQSYGDYSQVYATAMSPTGSQVAFIADEASSGLRKVLLLDVTKGTVSTVAELLAVSLGWSPDGKKLVISTPGGHAPNMHVVDAYSRSIRFLAEGRFPSWSPSGDWIAYLNNSGEQLHLIHPDGTGDRVVKDIGGRIFGYRYFGLSPVWSPDSTKLLLNEYKGDGDTEDVVLLELKSGHVSVKSRNSYSILGWSKGTSE